jgi:hypothetical protein
MTIQKINNEYFASGNIHGDFYMGKGDTFLEAINDCIEQRIAYVKKLFGNPRMSHIGNLPPGYSGADL